MALTAIRIWFTYDMYFCIRIHSKWIRFESHCHTVFSSIHRHSCIRMAFTSASGAICECYVHPWMRMPCLYTYSNSIQGSAFTSHSHLMNIVYTHLRFESKPNIVFTCDSHRASAFPIWIKTEYRIHMWFASHKRILDSNQNRIPYSHVIRITQAHFWFESKPNTVFTCNSHRESAFPIRIKTEYRIHMWFEYTSFVYICRVSSHFLPRWARGSAHSASIASAPCMRMDILTE